MTRTAAPANRTARAAGVKAAASRPRLTPLTPMRVQAAKSMSKLADHIRESHPDMLTHQHVRDAARMLRMGNEEAAQRHLRAAMFAMTPQSLMRNGMHTDDDHIAAREAMHGIHRHLLLVKDIADVGEKNQQAIRRDSGDGFTTPPAPDPDNGFGPGALAQKPTARQPPGNQALNAPNRTNGGGSDPAVADPVGPQPKGSKQFAYGWDDLAAVVELVNRRPKVAELSAASRLKAHDTASATAHRTASAHAKADEARDAHGEWTKVGVADLVAHQDGTVTSKKAKTGFAGSLAHENGKWAATHGDGTVSKHATKQTALAAMVTKHNKAGKAAGAGPGNAAVSAPVPAAVKPATAVAPNPSAAAKASLQGKIAAAKAQTAATGTAKPAVMHAADLSVRKDGTVVNKKTGTGVGEIHRSSFGVYQVKHSDGTTAAYGSKTDAVKAVARKQNQLAKSAAAGNAGASQPKPSVPAAAAKMAAAQPPQPNLSHEEKQRLIGIWSVSYRYSNTSIAAGKEGREFTNELHRLLATNKPPDTCGTGCQEAHKFLGMVDQDATVQHKELQRGITLSTADAERMFQPGKTMDMPAASWTTKASTAVQFSKGNAGPGKTKVILHTAPPAKGLDIAGMSNYPTEAEVVTGGRYSVDSVQTKGGVMHVYVTQGDFSAH
jgi:hypothetical protein